MRYSARTALVILVAILVSAFPAYGAKPIESTAIDYEIDIDGSFSEWDGMPVVYLDESIRLFAVAHDDQDIYLMFRFSDRQLARQIMHRGVMIWFNGDGKTKNKKEEFAVRYPGSPDIATELASEGQSEGAESGGQGSGRPAGGPPPGQALMRPNPGELTVVRNGIKEEVLADADSGIGAGSAIFEEVFTYELRIPFSEIGGKVGSSDPSQKRKLAIGIQIGGLTRAEMEMLQSEMKQRMGDMAGMGSMGGSRAGGGMGGMGGAGGMGGMGSPGSMGGAGGGGMGNPDGGGGRTPPDMDPEIDWLTVTLPASK